MAGLVPAIHVAPHARKDVDARDKPGHDGGKRGPVPYPNFQSVVSTTRSMNARTLADSSREVG